MKKCITKVLGIILSLLIMVMSVPVYAGAQTSANDIANSISWSEDFENMDFSQNFGDWKYQYNKSGSYTTATNNVYHNNDGSYVSIDTVNGVFGKANDDASLKFSSEIFGNSLSSDRDGNSYPEAIARSGDMKLYRSEMAYSSIDELNIKDYPNAVVQYSCEFALENINANGYKFEVTYYTAADSVASVGSGNRKRIVIAQFARFDNLNASVKVFDEDAGTIEQQKWHKLDLLLYSDLGMDFYLNGNKINNEKYYADSSVTTPLRAFGPFAFLGGSNVAKASSGSPAAPLYLDNVSTRLLFDTPVITVPANYNLNKFYIDMENSQGISGEFMPETIMGNFYPAYKKNITFRAVDGVYGKPGKIYEISNNANPMATSASGYDICQPYIQVGKKNGISPATSNLSAGDKVRISFNLANKHLVNNRYAEINGTGLASGNLTIKTDGVVTIFGKKMANLDVKSGKWYNFDLIITVGDTSSTADLYINGTKAGDTVTASASGTNITAINTVRLGYNGTQSSPVDGQKVFLEDGMYVDDIIFEYYPADGEEFNVTPVDIAESNGIVANELEATVTPALSATVGETKTDISISGASSFAFVNADGTAKTDEDSAEGGYLVINTTDGKTLVYESLNWSPAESSDFDSVTIDGESADVLVMNEGTWKKNNEKKGHEYTLAGGLGSKNSNDKALAIVTNGTYSGDTYNPYLYYSFSSNGVAKEFTAEFSVFAGGGENGIDIMLTYYEEDGTRQRKSVVNFNSNGDIESGDDVIGAWQPDRWYRVAVSCSPDSDNAELYINGVKYIADIAGQTDSPKAFANIRVTVDYPQGKAVSGVLGIDDFSFYYSGYCGEAAPVPTASIDASNVLVDGDIIYTKNALTSQTLALAVEYDFENAKVYTDSTYTAELGAEDEIDDNAVLVINDGLYYDYYSFKNLDSSYKPSIYVNARELPVLKNGEISARVCTDTAPGSQSKLIIAVYDGNEMKEVKISDIQPGFNVTRTEAITVSEYKPGITAKAFVWENMNTIKPLTMTAEK